MAEHDEMMTLSSIHRQLSDALSLLDRAGHHAAAAHLIAAIELIEADIDTGTDDRADAEPESAVSVIARRMSQKFGGRAQTVARGQLAEASGPAMLAWAAIINRIDE